MVSRLSMMMLPMMTLLNVDIAKCWRCQWWPQQERRWCEWWRWRRERVEGSSWGKVRLETGRTTSLKSRLLMIVKYDGNVMKYHGNVIEMSWKSKKMRFLGTQETYYRNMILPIIKRLPAWLPGRKSNFRGLTSLLWTNSDFLPNKFEASILFNS